MGCCSSPSIVIILFGITLFGFMNRNQFRACMMIARFNIINETEIEHHQVLRQNQHLISSAMVSLYADGAIVSDFLSSASAACGTLWSKPKSVSSWSLNFKLLIQNARGTPMAAKAMLTCHTSFRLST